MALGWYGPLIDLSRASSHLDDFVQLLVFVRSSQPVQKHTASKGGISSKTNIQVGDDTRSYFPVSLWQKHMGSMIVAGDVILLQNVKIVKFRNVLEATTIQISALTVLVHSYELKTSKGANEIVPHCQLGETAREKLRRVIEWVQHTESTFHHLQQADSCQKRPPPVKNWKSEEEKKLHQCMSISEVLSITTCCNASFLAGIKEMRLPFIQRTDEVEEEHMFSGKRLSMMADSTVAEDLICPGCKLCGSSMSSRLLSEQDKATLYCPKSFKYLHDVCLIYRPFLLYVCDESGEIPVLVKNNAAEILFGNISAERVYKCFQDERKNRIPQHKTDEKLHDCEVQRNMQSESGYGRTMPDFYCIWLILIKSLLQQGKNSPFRFEVEVNNEKFFEMGRFELTSFSMPC